MKPKEKAKELFDKMQVNVIYKSKSKDCAIIAVDEVIEAIDNVMLPNPFKQYWNKVKQEIQNL
jgi:uncharacterized protein YfaS (alpha-2-macroglobulin family)